MTYVREQTSTELAAHVRSLKKMAGWFDPLADRLWQEVEVLKAENDAARKDLQNLRSDNAQLTYALKQQEQSYLVLRGERDQLRAEVAGLKTGYQAYERVNAELKAEVEVFRGLLGEMRAIGNHAPSELTLRIDAAMGKGERS